MAEIEDGLVEELALDIVHQIRLMHFREGTSTTMQTKKLKEIIENKSKKLTSNAVRKNND